MADRGGGRNLSLFTCFRAWTHSFPRNSRTFRGGAVVGRGFFVVILVLSGSSTSSMFIFRGNNLRSLPKLTAPWKNWGNHNGAATKAPFAQA